MGMGQKKGYQISEEAFKLSILVIKYYKYTTKTDREFVLSKQILKSGTSIGANVMEAQEAQSKKDFLSKMSIALKEAIETKYRLRLLREGGYLSHFSEQNEMIDKANEMVGVLTKIVKTKKYNLSI
ncbi:MAG: four helix bundle protein [Candidatus Absconditabacterales bacterium]